MSDLVDGDDEVDSLHSYGLNAWRSRNDQGRSTLRSSRAVVATASRKTSRTNKRDAAYHDQRKQLPQSLSPEGKNQTEEAGKRESAGRTLPQRGDVLS